MTQSNENELRQIRREKLARLQEQGQDPFLRVSYDQTHHTQEILDQFDQLEGKNVSIAGRLMFKRVMGKASFCNIQDRDGHIQCYVTRDDLGEEAYALFKKSDIGDIWGVQGFVFRTKTGEITVHAKDMVLLSKSLEPLPEKFHGLQDTDLRFRQRYLDLIMNEGTRITFRKRSQILSEIRKFLEARDFIEVETPFLVENAGGAAARPFTTHYNALDIDVKLRISLELYLKRLIVGGMERVFEIGRVFRNEGVDSRHNPEFTLMELYQAYTDYNGMMELTESMFRYLAEKVNGSLEVQYGDRVLDFAKPFRKLTMRDAVLEQTGIDFYAVESDEQAIELAKEHHLEIEKWHKKGDIMNLFFDEYCEEKMIQPTFIMDHPIEISPLTKKKPENPEYVERFELYINGWEMANAYSELNDPIDQRERFAAQDAQISSGNEEANHTDEDFLHALEIGMPPTGGIGYGIDRLVMLLTNSESIREVLLFPTMKPLKTPQEQGDDQKSEAAATIENTSGKTFAENASDSSMPIFDTKKPDLANLVIEPLFEDFVDFDTFSKSDFRAVKVKECIAVPKSKKLLQFTLDDGTGKDRTILSGIHAYYEPEQLVGKTCIAITNLPPRKMMGIDSCGMLISAVHSEGEEERLHLLMVDPSIPAGAKLY
ncbi:MAG: lysine--tRNA ligase [Peptoniphilaceae bacterium]|nr:lysine--tRNA ligase [Peptoniphilaceae bacterium]